MAVLLLLLAAALFYAIFRPQPAGLPPGPGLAHEEPRAIVARGNLADDEQSNIDLFSSASPSVVHVTSLALRRSRLNLDVTEIPQGTGSGFMWDEPNCPLSQQAWDDATQTIRSTLPADRISTIVRAKRRDRRSSPYR